VSQLFSPRKFVDFGPNYLLPFMPPLAPRLIEGPKSSTLRRQVRECGPRRPGVYAMLDRHGELIYVGKAKCLRNRLLSYFRPRSRDPKAGRILSHSTAIAWEICSSEFAALHRELELIRRWRPRFNVLGQPHARRPTYLCVGRLPAPYVFLARQPPRDVLAWYGPVANGSRAGEAVRRLNDWFRLRDCPQQQQMHFEEQGELFPAERSFGCLRYEIGTCLGPCAGACSRRDYFDNLRALQAFLDGTDLSLLKALQNEMALAAGQQAYEKAAVLRDRLAGLTWLHQQLEQMRQLRRQGSFIYPLRGQDEQTLWYLIRTGQTVATVPLPTDRLAADRVAALIEAVYGKEYTGTREQLTAQRDSVLLVAAWFRRYPQERQRTLSPAETLARLRSQATT
jgi:excinuclease ABC subunit C